MRPVKICRRYDCSRCLALYELTGLNGYWLEVRKDFERIYSPIDSTPAAPIPQNALAAIKLPILWAKAHQAVVDARTTRPIKYNGRRPIVSDSRPINGWSDVEVSKKAVDSQDAEFEA